MSKFKKSMVGEINKEKQFEKQQEVLKDKYNIDKAEDVVIVEKSNTFKFTVTMLRNLIRVIATILLFTFATIGLITLVYPLSRDAFFEVINEIYTQFVSYVG